MKAAVDNYIEPHLWHHVTRRALERLNMLGLTFLGEWGHMYDAIDVQVDLYNKLSNDGTI